MSTDGEKKLTKYKSAVTIVTADFANSIFGGLYGSSDGSSLDPEDPRVRGHVHSGVKGDGYAPKINLVHHVEDQLLNLNLADDAVTKRNVRDGMVQSEAIPEYRVDGANTYYYLDLRSIRADLTFQEIEDPAGDGSENKLIRQRSTTFDGASYEDIEDVWNNSAGFDFVFGSSSLDDIDSDGDGDNRFQFDKSNASFRAGGTPGSEWDESNRGSYSIGLGFRSTASGNFSSVLGGFKNTASGAYAVVGAGNNNQVTGDVSGVLSGSLNTVSSDFSSALSGSENTVSGDYAAISGGFKNEASGDYAAISGGQQNKAIGGFSSVSGGDSNESQGEYSSVSGGVRNIAQANFSGVSSGADNKAQADFSNVAGGNTNNVFAASVASNIAGGSNNNIDGSYSSISGGKSNNVAGEQSFIGGGDDHNLNGDYSTILGGHNATVNGEYSTVSGGNENSVTGNFSSIFSGQKNLLKTDNAIIAAGTSNSIGNSSEYSAVFVGRDNDITGSFNFIAAGDNSSISGSKSIILGGTESSIVSSANSVLIGHGKVSPENLSIGEECSSLLSKSTFPSTPSNSSGVFGGYNNHIVGGPKAASGMAGEGNFISEGRSCIIGGVETTIFNCKLIGSIGSEISGNRGSGTQEMHNNLIVGSEYSSILMGPSIASANVMNSLVLGGYMNGINHSYHTTDTLSPWFDTQQHIGESEFGVQTSSVLGGLRNSVTNSLSSSFGNNSLYCTVVGGQSNIISSSYGSSILGGGTFVDTRPGSKDVPEYDTLPYHYSNLIVKGHHSAIINGSSNFIAPHLFPFNETGVPWNSKAVPGQILLDDPVNATATGKESYAYLYGQNSMASGGHTQEKFVPKGFLTASIESSPGTKWNVLLGSQLYPDNSTRDQPGSAQCSDLTFFGSWNYNSSEIDPSWKPNGSTYFESKAYLDGGRDTAIAQDRCFIPRFPASYSFRIHGSISFTEATATSPFSAHHMISFTYNGYIVFQPDGSGDYGGQLSDVVSTNGSTLKLFTPGAITATDFSLGFVPEWDIASNSATTPLNGYSSGGGLSASGKWPAPETVAGLKSWPPKFCIYLVNNSGDPGAIGGNGTSSEYVGESIVAKAEVVENLLYLGKFNVGP